MKPILTDDGNGKYTYMFNTGETVSFSTEQDPRLPESRPFLLPDDTRYDCSYCASPVEENALHCKNCGAPCRSGAIG